MAGNKQAIGLISKVYRTKNRGRSKPLHLRGLKKLGPKSPDKGNRGKY